MGGRIRCGSPENKSWSLEEYKTFLKQEKEQEMRTFDTGATRGFDDDKLDYEAFLSPLVIRRYAEYLHKHRIQADGKRRDSDNWQKGIPLSAYIKSLWRHLVDLWTFHRDPKQEIAGTTTEDALCAIIFNASGYLHELLKVKGVKLIVTPEKLLSIETQAAHATLSEKGEEF